MKASSFLKLFLGGMLVISVAACNGGREDHDGRKSLEGDNDPANTGGKLGGYDLKTRKAVDKDTATKAE